MREVFMLGSPLIHRESGSFHDAATEEELLVKEIEIFGKGGKPTVAVLTYHRADRATEEVLLVAAPDGCTATSILTHPDCSECDGTGVIELLTSNVPCRRCKP